MNQAAKVIPLGHCLHWWPTREGIRTFPLIPRDVLCPVPSISSSPWYHVAQRCLWNKCVHPQLGYWGLGLYSLCLLPSHQHLGVNGPLPVYVSSAVALQSTPMFGMTPDQLLCYPFRQTTSIGRFHSLHLLAGVQNVWEDAPSLQLFLVIDGVVAAALDGEAPDNLIQHTFGGFVCL